ncbi:universal stress protein [Natronolimnohabitans innermongolicus]|uniref:UspA domain-containing protein n=1 Tax=Natronolimnohabitans innermongolicus JCM 12255 TaxID=1227499 RepID=L9X735_9EURY|nr:universal stress protein [Natronolimnohabitans innermongolicus]ELY57505.1 UspA domain-containing protein [Natronolimnohabitans innermongolicus JCM 12255]
MPARVLVPFDDSEPAHDALEYAIDLFPDGEFVALTVVDTTALPFIPNSADDEESRAALDEVFEDVDEQLTVPETIARERDVPLETRTRIGSPAQEIIEFAENESIDHVVMGSRGRSGVRRILLGSVAEVVVRHSAVPVTVVR